MRCAIIAHLREERLRFLATTSSRLPKFGCVAQTAPTTVSLSIMVPRQRGFMCYSDHQLVCLTYNLALPIAKRQPRRRTTQCFAVGDLVSAVGSLVDDVVAASSTQAAYCHALQGHLAEWPIESSIEDKWNRLKSDVVQSAEIAIGRARHRQLDWFLDTLII